MLQKGCFLLLYLFYYLSYYFLLLLLFWTDFNFSILQLILQMMAIIFGRWVVVALMESSIRWTMHHLRLTIHHIAHCIWVAGRWTWVCINCTKNNNIEENAEDANIYFFLFRECFQGNFNIRHKQKIFWMKIFFFMTSKTKYKTWKTLTWF